MGVVVGGAIGGVGTFSFSGVGFGSEGTDEGSDDVDTGGARPTLSF